MRDTKEKLRLTCGVTAALFFPTQRLRVPSPMISQHTLDAGTNSIRDTGLLGQRFMMLECQVPVFRNQWCNGLSVH